ncbi:MAG: hypothetical protein JWQ35_1403 [Bacteriovoracaceae bacterium]|nr:hypothetical protein [Bacteriovoracaceae bacterium]
MICSSIPRFFLIFLSLFISTQNVFAEKKYRRALANETCIVTIGKLSFKAPSLASDDIQIELVKIRNDWLHGLPDQFPASEKRFKDLKINNLDKLRTKFPGIQNHLQLFGTRPIKRALAILSSTGLFIGVVFEYPAGSHPVNAIGLPVDTLNFIDIWGINVRDYLALNSAIVKRALGWPDAKIKEIGQQMKLRLQKNEGPLMPPIWHNVKF